MAPASPPRPWVRYTRWLVAHRGLLDVIITVVGVVTVGLGTLVLEDVLPVAEATGQHSSAVWDGRRVSGFGAGLLVLGLLVWWRSWLVRDVGTLYYVRYLKSGMSDWHLHTEREQARGHLRTRRVTGRMTRAARDGVVDIADDVELLVDELHANLDDHLPGSGYTLAPNLLWPAALGLGAQVHVPTGVRLLEFGEASLTWRMDAAAAEGPQFAKPTRRIEPATSQMAASTVLVTVDLTGQGTCTPPSGFMPDRRIRVGVWGDGPGGIDEQTRSVLVSTDDTAGSGESDRRPVGADAVVHPRAAVDAVFSALHDALHDPLQENPEATVYFILRVPKTVAFAVGAALRAAVDVPWRRLVLLLFDQGASPGSYHMVRVSAGQPSAADLAQRARQQGLVCSGVEDPANGLIGGPEPDAKRDPEVRKET